MIPMA